MIEHDDVGAAGANCSDFRAGTGSAIDRNEELWFMRLPAAVDSFRA